MLLTYDFGLGNVTELYSYGDSRSCLRNWQYWDCVKNMHGGPIWRCICKYKRVCNIIESTMHLFNLYRVMSLSLLNRAVSQNNAMTTVSSIFRLHIYYLQPEILRSVVFVGSSFLFVGRLVGWFVRSLTSRQWLHWKAGAPFLVVHTSCINRVIVNLLLKFSLPC